MKATFVTTTASDIAAISRKKNYAADVTPNLIALDSTSISSCASSSSDCYSLSSSPSSSSSFSSSARMRSKYLHRIGIARTHATTTETTTTSTTTTNRKQPQSSSAPEGGGGRISRDLRNVPRFNAPLRYVDEEERGKEGEEEDEEDEDEDEDDEDDDDDAHCRRGRNNSLDSPGLGGRGRVTFRENVTVVPIPMRCEYSDRIRTRLWSSGDELCKIIERNREEFAAEDYDWHSACTEERMYQCIDTNELIHPIHLESGRYMFGTGGRVVRNQYAFDYC